jgi:eukaryotic-like serine/threonine-protein kinase
MRATENITLNNGKYIINGILGENQFEITYLATQSMNGQPVVIKTLHPSLSKYEQFKIWQEQFAQKAQKFSQYLHPHLVKMIDGFIDTDRWYLVCNYVPGVSLVELIKSQYQNQGLTETSAIYYIRQIAGAIKLLHQYQIIHGNIKPENIILRKQTESVVITDFGISKSIVSKYLSNQASILENEYTPIELYFPEVPLTPATDIYSLAATLYFLITGHPPLPINLRLNDNNNIDKKINLDTEEITSSLSAPVKIALTKGLEIRPKSRIQTLEEWLDILPDNRSALISKISNHQYDHEDHQKKNNSPVKSHQRRNNPPVQSHQISLPKLAYQPVQSISLPKVEEKKPDEQIVDNNNYQKNMDNNEIEENPNYSANSYRQKKTKKFIKIRKMTEKKQRSPVKIILLTGAIAALVGSALGLVVRGLVPKQPGATPFHSKQSFPPRQDWPVFTSQRSNNSEEKNKPSNPQRKIRKDLSNQEEIINPQIPRRRVIIRRKPEQNNPNISRKNRREQTEKNNQNSKNEPKRRSKNRAKIKTKPAVKKPE